MISFDEALSIVLGSAVTLPERTVSLGESLGRVSSRDLVAPYPMPRFDNSAVDGYAVSGLTTEYQIVGTQAAGDRDSDALLEGQAKRIFTGASVPIGADAVVMQEDVQVVGDRIQVSEPVVAGQHVRRMGEEFKAEDVVLPAGSLMNAASVSLAASLGMNSIGVYDMPEIGILVTGNELVRPGEPLDEGQIYESNSWGLCALLESWGLGVEDVRRSKDDLSQTAEVIREMLADCDVIIVTGGVSVGGKDVVKDALHEIGVEERCWRVALKPGKPFYFGVHGQKAVFGLPGNPMSTLVTASMLVRPYLRAIQGHAQPATVRISATIVERFKKRAGRREFVPCRVFSSERGLRCTAFSGQGSHMLGGLAKADGLIDVPAETTCIEALETVRFVPISDASTWESSGP